MVKIEIDGKELEVRQGQMIIEAADEIGVDIPRFCYHKKLSIAANCRMCLVEVANAPKPLPACATPVSEGMKVFTKSVRAIDAQKAVMEFLLINHPLDCPICDQGGQCELQDVALEYGRDSSRYSEGKRVVKDKNIGPLISTEMTRCIHCTRCVRFGTEIAGVRELGATKRGEFMEIGTFVEKSVNSEMSGNVIDLCPVGALTSKPFRFQARAWELTSLPGVSMHDCVGSNLFFHTFRNKVMRALPRSNEALNEVWLSDRDRFSYEGLNHSDRLTAPMIKRHGKWVTVDWKEALDYAAEKIQEMIADHGGEQFGVIASPNSTLEEFYLLQKLFRSLGCDNIDHRLRQVDSAHQDYLATYPTLGIALSELESQEQIILIGSDIRKEQPLVAHRLRKATLHGGQVYAINPLKSDFNFEAMNFIAPQGDLCLPLLEMIAALTQIDATALHNIPAAIKNQLSNIHVSDEVTDAVKAMKASQKVSVILGAYAVSHPKASQIYLLSRVLAHLCHATWGEMSNGANSAGGWIAGAIPHRLPMGENVGKKALSAHQMWQAPQKGYFLLNCEPELDSAAPGIALEALKQARSVIVLSSFDNANYRNYADVILPITPITEMSGTYVNAMGNWQNFQAVVTPLGQARPAWKVLRVLANLMQVCGFSYDHVGEVFAEIENLHAQNALLENALLSMPCEITVNKEATEQLIRLAPTPLYAQDGITRRAAALQETVDAQNNTVKLNSFEAGARHLIENQKVWVMQNKMKSTKALAIEIDERLPNGVALVASSISETHTLGEPFGMIELIPVEE